MEFIRNIDVLEILKLGAIGLGFLLAALSFLLIRKEQSKEKPSKAIVNITRTFMIFSIIIFALGISSELLITKNELSIELSGNELTVEEIQAVKLNQLNPDTYFINSEVGFAFKKPNDNWSKIQAEKGILGIFRLMGIQSEILTEENIVKSLPQSPLGKLLLNSKHYYFLNSNSKTTLTVTDSTSSVEIEAALDEISKELLNPEYIFGLDTTNIEEKEEYFEEMKDYRQELIGFNELEIKESFILSVLPKDSLVESKKGLTLPSFFTSISQAFGTNTDKLIANENQILAGTEIKLSDVKINNEIVDLNNKKWFMFTENREYFFMIEITYPANISSSISRWDELQEILNSFKLLN